MKFACAEAELSKLQKYSDKVVKFDEKQW